MRDALEGNKFNVYKKMTCRMALLGVKLTVKRLTARKRRFKALFDNQLQSMLFPRSFERGPIEALNVATIEMSAIKFPRSNERGPIEAC